MAIGFGKDEGVMNFAKYMFYIFILMPKIFISGVVWYYGSRFLIHSGSVQDIILNTVGLLFIMDIDEGMFKLIDRSAALVQPLTLVKALPSLQVDSPFQRFVLQYIAICNIFYKINQKDGKFHEPQRDESKIEDNSSSGSWYSCVYMSCCENEQYPAFYIRWPRWCVGLVLRIIAFVFSLFLLLVEVAAPYLPYAMTAFVITTQFCGSASDSTVSTLPTTTTTLSIG